MGIRFVRPLCFVGLWSRLKWIKQQQSLEGEEEEEEDDDDDDDDDDLNAEALMADGT